MSEKHLSFSFGKYHGLFNNFILIDWRDLSNIFSQNGSQSDGVQVVKQKIEQDYKKAQEAKETGSSPTISFPFSAKEARRLCRVSSGIGADGIMVCLPPLDSTTNNYVMRMLNADGSIAEMCGNGIRCLAAYLFDCDLATGKISGSEFLYSFSTLAGTITCDVSATPHMKESSHKVRVQMSSPILEASQIPCSVSPDLLTELPFVDLGYAKNVNSALYVPFPDIIASSDAIQVENALSELRIDTTPMCSPSVMSPTTTCAQEGLSADTAISLFSEWKLYSKTFTAISMGNPHVVVRLPECDSIASQNNEAGIAQADAQWERFKTIAFPILGPWLCKYKSMFPKGANIEFVRSVDSKTQVGEIAFETLVWERGCGATMACGTGACAVVVASKLCAEIEINSQSPIEVILPGGSLWIEFSVDKTHPGVDELPPVYMTGPSTRVFSGKCELFVV